MKVSLEYNDNHSFTIDEVVAAAKRNYGSGVMVKIMPESSRPADLVEFAISAWITAEQISFYYDDPNTYKSRLNKLKNELLEAYSEAIDSVIQDNERKLMES